MTTLQPSPVALGGQRSPDARLRPLPYPYQAMLAICSDVDETPDRRVYREIMRFLNTTEETAMGSGVGLEVGNSIYFDMPSDQFAYWNTDDAGRAMVRTLMCSGHIDCLHSYGDLATTRTQVGRALEELARHGCQLRVWVDHGTAVTNFGSDIMHGHGDEVGHCAYHADLTTAYGIQYVWRGRVTSIAGQDIPARWTGIFHAAHPLASGRTLLKEVLKQQLARRGNVKYAMHARNETLCQTVLRDGRAVYEFLRCNPHWGGVSSCDEGRSISKVLTRRTLDRLVARGGTCLLYTHLGKIDHPEVPFTPEAVSAFRRLAEDYYAGKILVTTTRRLLEYVRALQQLEYSSQIQGNFQHIHIQTQNGQGALGQVSRGQLDGVTFYVPHGRTARLSVDEHPVTDLQENAPDLSGCPSVSIPWRKLVFPGI